MSLLFSPRLLLLGALVAVTALFTAPAGAVDLLSENFDDLPRMDSVDELDGAGEQIKDAWSEAPPAGWLILNQGDWTNTITHSASSNRESDRTGVTEWEGWSFADPVFWNSIAGQNRSLFTS